MENAPASATARASARIASASAGEMIPCFASIRACAWEPCTSNAASRTSKLTDSVNVSTSASVEPEKRPPQSFCEPLESLISNLI